MKAVKYIISFCILFVGILIIGESHIFRLDNFYSEFSTTTLYLQRNTTEEEMVDDILHSAERNEIEVFTFKRSPRSTFYTEYDIYGTSNVEDYINENLKIFEGEYTSLFLGNIHFTFNHLEHISGLENVHHFYMIGSKDQVHQFKMDLIDKYAGNHPKEGDVNHELRNNIIAIWLLMLMIILLFTFYDMTSQKKENLIRVTMGERISKMIWRNILLDSFAFVAMFTLIIYILSRYTYVFFRFDISLFLFFILLFSNALLYMNLYFYHLKAAFSNARGSKKQLSLNYSLKLVTTMITIFVISSNAALIFESYQLYKQKSFFENYADYYYTRLEYRLILNNDGSITYKGNENVVVQTSFYREFYDKFDATMLVSMDGLLRGKGILANKNTFGYLSSEIKELQTMTLNKDFYFLLPKNLASDPNIRDEFKEVMRFFQWDHLNYDLIYYDDDVDMVSIDENYLYGSKFVNNPIILYNNMTAEEMMKNQQNNTLQQHITYVHEIMYKINDDEFDQFVKKYDLTDQIATKTNVLENYEHYWLSAKRVLYMNFIFSFLVLLLEFIIIHSIIKMEYEVNAIELSIKKVMGYSILEKNGRIILQTAVLTLLSILSAVIAALIIELDEIYYLAAGGIIILILELIVITLYIRRMENAKIPKILKGGNI